MMREYKKLWAAVLDQAIKDAGGSVEHRKEYARHLIMENAHAWFLSEDQGIGSFCWICSILEIEPEYARVLLESTGRIQMGSLKEESPQTQVLSS